MSSRFDRSMSSHKSYVVKKKKAEQSLNDSSNINKTDNNSKPKSAEPLKNNCAKPTGIMFNHNLKIRSANYNKPSTEKAHDNQKLLAVDDVNLVPNKMYKIVVVDGQIMLAEHNDEDIIEVDDDDDNDSDVEIIEKDTINNVQENNLTNNVRILNKNVADSPRKYPNTVSIPANMPVNNHDYCANSRKPVPKQPEIINTSEPATTNARNAESNENIMKGLATINGPEQSDNQMYTTQKDLADARKGKAMVLLPLEKYKTLKKKLNDALEDYQAEVTKAKEFRVQEEIRRIKEEGEKEQREIAKAAKLRTVACQTDKHYEQAITAFEKTKKNLARIFTEAQMNLLTKSVKEKYIKWTDEEMEKVVFLKQIISHSAYIFLKYKLRFPLPTLPVVNAWMLKKNMIVRAKRKSLQSTAKLSNVAVQETKEQATLPEPVELKQIYSIPNQNVDSETAQAINSITQDIGGTMEPDQILLSAEFGAEFIVYADNENVQDEDNTLNDLDYMQDGNVATSEEVVEMVKVKRKRTKPVADSTPRCMLCNRPFDTKMEVIDHVATHYPDSSYTTYLQIRSPYTCEFCNEVAQSRFHLIHHHQVHLGIDHLKCYYPGCNYVGKNRDNLKSHHDVHKPASLKCEQCGRMFKTLKYLRQHAARRHAARTELRCALCLRACFSEFTYRQHMLSHTRPPRIKCRSAGCPERFYSGVLMRRHARTAHVRAFACHLCPATYPHQQALKRHLSLHETRKVSSCVQCMKVFYDYGEYYAHCLTHKHHKTDSDKYKCICGESFKAIQKLKVHKRQCPVVNENNETKTGQKSNTKRKLTRISKENVTLDKDATHDGEIEKKKFKPNIIIDKQDIIQVINDKEVKIIAMDGQPRVVVLEKAKDAHSSEKPKLLKLAKIISLPPHLKDKVIHLPTKNQQKVITLPTNDQQVDMFPIMDKAISTGQQQKVVEHVTNNQQNVSVKPDDIKKNIDVPENILAKETKVEQDWSIQQDATQQQVENSFMSDDNKSNKISVIKGTYSRKVSTVTKNAVQRESPIASSHVTSGNVMSIKQYKSFRSISQNRNTMEVDKGQANKTPTHKGERRNIIVPLPEGRGHLSFKKILPMTKTKEKRAKRMSIQLSGSNSPVLCIDEDSTKGKRGPTLDMPILTQQEEDDFNEMLS